MSTRLSKLATDTELNWDVVKTPITVNGKEIDSHFAVVRSDNEKVLHVHKESYNVFQNTEFRKLLDEMQKITGFENQKFQEYKEGRIILGYLENTKDTQVNGLQVDKYLVLGNSHDGTKGIFLGTSELMIRCLNQFGRIVKNDIIKHTKNNGSKIDELKRAYEVYFNYMEVLGEQYAKMKKVSIDQNLIEALTARLFDVKENEELSTRKANQIFDFKKSVVKETADLGMNVFGLFHAATHYTTHALKGENVYGNLFGTANAMNEKAFTFALELI